MKDFRGKMHYVTCYEEITWRDFNRVYNEMSISKDKLPVASTVQALTDSNGCTLRNAENKPVYDVAIFYEMHEEQDFRTLGRDGKVIDLAGQVPPEIESDSKSTQEEMIM